MTRIYKAAFLMSVLLVVVASLYAQTPTPAPELKKLDYFTGTWQFDGVMKASPMGQAGKMTMTEENSWMQGGFFVVSKSKFKGTGMGPGMEDGSGIAIMGYNPDDKMYRYYEYNSWGEANESKGTFDGSTWTWLGEDKMGKGRFIMKILSPTSYDFQYDMSQDGKNWTTFMDGKATKIK